MVKTHNMLTAGMVHVTNQSDTREWSANPTTGRLKAQPGMKLPLADLTTLYVNLERPPMVRNFALVYVEQAFERATPEDRAAQITRLLQGVATRTAQHREMILRMAVTGLAVHEKHAAAEVNEMAFMLDAQDRAAFLFHCLEYLMYQPNTSGHAPVARPGPTPQQAALQAVANVAAGAGGDVAGALGGAAPAAPTAPTAPPGLSPASVARILGPGGAVPNTKDLGVKKLALLEFFNRAKDATVLPAEMILHYLVATCDADNEVARRGEDLLKRRCTWETNRPSVDLEDPALVARLYRLFLGGAETVPEASRALPASHELKMRLVSLLCRSVSAANAFPSTVQCIFTCLYGVGTTVRLKAAGMELAVWVLRHATDAQLKQASPLLLRGMLQLLDGKTAVGGAAGDGGAAAGGDEDHPAAAASTGASNYTTGTVSLRGFCYQALGHLAMRQPALVTGSPDIAERVFSALTSEPEGCRASVQDAARSLATAYGGCVGGVAMAIEGLLLASIEGTAAVQGAPGVGQAGGDTSRRLVAAQWARKLFPFSHVPARYLCVVAAGDAKPDVREEGRAGLRPPEDDEDVVKKRKGGKVGESANGTNGDAAAADKKMEEEEGGAERSLPPAEPMLRYLASRHPALTKPALLSSQLPLPPLAMAAASDSFITLSSFSTASSIVVGPDTVAAAAAAAASASSSSFFSTTCLRGKGSGPQSPTWPMASAAVPASVGFLHPATATKTCSAAATFPSGRFSPAPPAAPAAAT
jgi:proteasome component ECM29